MVNIHTDDRVLRVKIFLSFKVNPTQKICSSICFFTFFRGTSLFYCREGGGGREGVRRGCSEDFWGIAWFSGEAEMILVFGNIIYKGRTVDNRLQMMEGGGSIHILWSLRGLGRLCCRILRPISTPTLLPLLEIRNDWSLSTDKRVFTTLGGTFALTLS